MNALHYMEVQVYELEFSSEVGRLVCLELGGEVWNMGGLPDGEVDDGAWREAAGEGEPGMKPDIAGPARHQAGLHAPAPQLDRCRHLQQDSETTNFTHLRAKHLVYILDAHCTRFRSRQPS